MAQKDLNETMLRVEREINGNPAPIAGMHTVFQFEIDGEVYQVQMKEGEAKVLPGAPETPECTLILSNDNFHKFLAGKLNGTMAFMTGKLKVNGDMAKALKLESIIKQYDLNL